MLLLQRFPLTQLPFEGSFLPADASRCAGVFPEIGLFGLTFEVLKVGGQFREVKDALVAPLPVRQCASRARGFLPTCWVLCCVGVGGSLTSRDGRPVTEAGSSIGTVRRL